MRHDRYRDHTFLNDSHCFMGEIESPSVSQKNCGQMVTTHARKYVFFFLFLVHFLDYKFGVTHAHAYQKVLNVERRTFEIHGRANFRPTHWYRGRILPGDDAVDSSERQSGGYDVDSVGYIKSDRLVDAAAHQECFRAANDVLFATSDPCNRCSNILAPPQSASDIHGIVTFDHFPVFQHQVINSLPTTELALRWWRNSCRVAGDAKRYPPLGDCDHVKFLVRSGSLEMKYLTWIGVPDDRLEIFDNTVAYRSISWPFPVWSLENGSPDTYPKGLFDAFVQSSLAQSRPRSLPKSPYVVYLGRPTSSPQSAPRHRSVLHQNSFLNRLKSKLRGAYEVVHLGWTQTSEKMNSKGGMSFVSHLMHGASAVVGLHGGAFSNIVWCRPGTHVVEVAYAPVKVCGEVRYCFAAIAHSRGLRYHMLSPEKSIRYPIKEWYETEHEYRKTVQLNATRLSAYLKRILTR